MWGYGSRYGNGYGYGFRPYVSVASRRANAAREAKKLTKSGRKLAPIQLAGTKIATTFWGKAWCTNLEAYSDYENRLPRGRTYVRNGSVLDLQIQAGKVTALVSGSSLYKIDIAITPLAAERWKAVKKACAGQIGSLIELLQGRFSQSVMDVVAQAERGLFPAPSEIKMKCSCPDWADLCKHLAAVLYGVGARLDTQPELLFLLRKVDHLELIAQAGANVGKQAKGNGKGPTLADDELADVFGIEIAGVAQPAADPPAKVNGRTRAGHKGRKVAAMTAGDFEPDVELRADRVDAGSGLTGDVESEGGEGKGKRKGRARSKAKPKPGITSTKVIFQRVRARSEAMEIKRKVLAELANEETAKGTTAKGKGKRKSANKEAEATDALAEMSGESKLARRKPGRPTSGKRLARGEAADMAPQAERAEVKTGRGQKAVQVTAADGATGAKKKARPPRAAKRRQTR